MMNRKHIATALWAVATLPAFAQTTAPAGESAATYNLVLLPDTQNYPSKFPQHLTAQTRWVADNASTISFVLQQGDITNNNRDKEWKVVANAFGLMDKVPFTFVPGNHDIGTNGKSDVRETTGMNTYLPYSKYSNMPNFGGAFEPGKMDNTWHHFTTGDVKWIILSLEFGPRNSVIEWAKTIIEKNRDSKVIINTHAYMYSDDTRIGPEDKWNPQVYGLGKATGADAVNDGEMMWDKLVSQYPNVLFVFNGHVLNDGTGYLVSKGKAGNKVYQMLANYQSGVEGSEEGGKGYLRIVSLDVAGRKASVKTWSPVTMQYKMEPDQQFEITDIDFK